jgi:hypothetical protein
LASFISRRLELQVASHRRQNSMPSWRRSCFGARFVKETAVRFATEIQKFGSAEL